MLCVSHILYPPLFIIVIAVVFRDQPATRGRAAARRRCWAAGSAAGCTGHRVPQGHSTGVLQWDGWPGSSPLCSPSSSLEGRMGLVKFWRKMMFESHFLSEDKRFLNDKAEIKILQTSLLLPTKSPHFQSSCDQVDSCFKPSSLACTLEYRRDGLFREGLGSLSSL